MGKMKKRRGGILQIADEEYGCCYGINLSNKCLFLDWRKNISIAQRFA